MAIFLIVIAAFLLIGAVVLGIVRNNRSGGKPGSGTHSDGTPRASS